MHGNTETTASGVKTRRFDRIQEVRPSICRNVHVAPFDLTGPLRNVQWALCQELRQNFAIHTELGSHLGGVHFELTGDNVTGTAATPHPSTARKRIRGD